MMDLIMPDEEINEANIDKALNFLRLTHPEIATPETAIKVLETMQVLAHQRAEHGKPVEFEDAVKLVMQSYSEEEHNS